MELIATGHTDELGVWEISRSTRDRAVWAALIGACIDADVDLAVNGKVHDPADPDDGFVLDLGAALAVREAGVISKRTRRGKAARAAAGHPAGYVPYGYKRIIDPDTGRTIGRERHPEQAPIVQEIVRRLLAREPADAIAKDLTRRGIPTGVGERWLGRHLRSVILRCPDNPLSAEIARRLAAGEPPKTIAADLNERSIPKPIPSAWRGGNLRTLAARPTYAGLRVHQGRVLDGVKGTWPPIITEAEHRQLVAMLADPERDKFRNSTAVRHLGTGIFRCGRDGCTGRMRVLQQPTRAPAYCCRDCHKVSRGQAEVDQLVETLMWRRLAQPDVLELLARAAQDDAEAEQAVAEVIRLRAKLAAARQAWDDDLLTLEEYHDMKARTEPKIRAAEERARPRALPAALYAVAGPDAMRKWQALDVKDKRAIVAALVDVTILPAGRGHWRFDPEKVVIRWRS
jgi:DNA invertase Pin-like site-specific DNA recombinase